MHLLNETVLWKTKSTLFNLLMRETSQFLCYERLLNMIYVAYKNAFFREMQFWSHCYRVVSYPALFRLSVYKIPAVYLSGAKKCVFLHDTRLWFPDFLLFMFQAVPVPGDNISLPLCQSTEIVNHYNYSLNGYR